MADRTAPQHRDPVCGMMVDPAATPHAATHEGKPVYFCSARCKERFEAGPEAFPNVREAKSAPAGTRYTCPMHPEIVRDAPGDCPICGMALEPMNPTRETGPNPELVDFRRRLWVGVPLAQVAAILEMGEHVGLPVRATLGARLQVWLQFAVATPVVLWVALPFFRRGWASVVNRSPNMWTLIALGTGAAYVFSVVATVAPQLFPAAMRDAMGMAPVYYEAAAVIIVLVLVGQVMELVARERTGDAIRALLDLAPTTARRLSGDGEHDVPLEAVVAGDRLRVRPGESVPVWTAWCSRAAPRSTRAC